MESGLIKFLRVSIIDNILNINSIRDELRELEENEIKSSILDLGEISNISGDYSEYVTIAFELISGLSINLLSSFIYDKIKSNKKVKINGIEFKNCSIGEINIYIHQEILKNNKDSEMQ